MREPAKFSGRRWRSPSRQSKLTRAPVEGIAVGEAGFHKASLCRVSVLQPFDLSDLVDLGATWSGYFNGDTLPLPNQRTRDGRKD